MGGTPKAGDAKLSRADIVATARRLLADEGADALTMRRLGEACGVRGAALYWHFKDKDELLGHIIDSVIGDLDVGTDGQRWDERLRVLGHSLRRLLVDHPGLAVVAASGYTLPDSVLQHLDELFGALTDAGFTPRQALTIHYAILTFTTGFVIYETSSPMFGALAAPPASRERAARAERFGDLADARHPHLAEVAEVLGAITVDDLFEQSLGAVVDGWSTRLAARAGARS